MDVRSGKEQQLTNLKSAGDGMDPCWSPDGKRIAFSSGRSGKGWRLYVIDADGGNVKEINDSTSYFGWMHNAWSPDGKKIAYAHTDDNGGVEIFVCDPDGNHIEISQRASLTGGRL